MNIERIWHIYCSIVDNFGDVGICWRLAKQLQNQYGVQVFLWIDDWDAADYFFNRQNDLSPSFLLSGVHISSWSCLSDHQDITGNIVLEAFSCHLPEITMKQLQVRQHADPPIWIHLEYLSAEPWVENVHLCSSRFAKIGIPCYFFVMSPRVLGGGLLRESQIDDWQLPQVLKQPGTFLCFAYAHAPYRSWVESISKYGIKIKACGKYAQEALTLNRDCYDHIQLMPFVDQDLFDQELRTSDVLWVRGEDSVVRALWSGRPFIWQLYPQDDETRREKLLAWLDILYQWVPCSKALEQLYTRAHLVWNALEADTQFKWDELWSHPIWYEWNTWHQNLTLYARQQDDLVKRLHIFLGSRVI